MAKGSKYAAFKVYLEHCGRDEITLTLAQIAELVGGLPQSAYVYTAPWYDGHGGPLAKCWLEAGYTSCRVVPGKQVTFVKRGGAPPKAPETTRASRPPAAPPRPQSFQMARTLDLFREEATLLAALDKTAREYRLYEPGWYLYRQIIRFSGDRITHDFVELVYVTLSAWNMNSRGARLNEYADFEASVFACGDALRQLAAYDIGDIAEHTGLQAALRDLFFNLKLVAPGKPTLVTTAKTLHFFLPHLVAPIDRKYTLNFFRGNVNVPPGKEEQFSLFLHIQKEFSAFAAARNLEQYQDNRWNLTVPKIMDNLLIGYMKL